MTICARCKRRIAHPVTLGGVSFGAKCASIVTGAKPQRQKAAPPPNARQADLFAEAAS